MPTRLEIHPNYLKLIGWSGGDFQYHYPKLRHRDQIGIIPNCSFYKQFPPTESCLVFLFHWTYPLSRADFELKTSIQSSKLSGELFFIVPPTLYNNVQPSHRLIGPTVPLYNLQWHTRCIWKRNNVLTQSLRTWTKFPYIAKRNGRIWIKHPFFLPILIQKVFEVHIDTR